MTFKDLKSGYAVYLFDRNSLHYEQGKLMSISAPRADLSLGITKMVVDITVMTSDGKQNTYSVADSEQCAYAGTLMLTTSKECVANEVRTISAQAEETLAKVDETRRKAETCKQLLEELDTAFKEKQQTEQRFQKIEERFGAIGEKMDKILKLIETKP
jgi:peptidoglycan hydrolase CwlO-like protein